MTQLKFARPAIALAALLLALTGCATETKNAGEPSASGDLGQVMSDHDLDGMDAVELIDHLDRLGGSERPTEMMASVQPDELVLSSGGQESSLAMPDDRFYLSLAPYVDQTHECFNHSLTTCQGELTAQDVQVEVKDRTNDTVLVDDTITTFDNGFVGLWLPRDIEGTIRVTFGGKSGEVDFTTDDDAATCLTTLQLV